MERHPPRHKLAKARGTRLGETWEPETPELRAEVLADRLAERDTELAKEQERRRAAERHSETSSTTGGDRLVELDEESDHERRIRAWTSQGYTRIQAEHILEFNDREEIGQVGEGLHHLLSRTALRNRGAAGDSAEHISRHSANVWVKS